MAAVEKAAAYVGPSVIHLADPHMLELLQMRYVRAKLCTSAVGRIQNRILSVLSPRITFKMAATHHRVTRDREWDNSEVGMWVAHHGAEHNEEALPGGTVGHSSSLPPIFFEDLATPPPTATSWEWTADHTQHMSLHDLATCTWQAREEEALATRDADRAQRHELPRWVSNTIPFAARMWKLKDLTVGPRARAARFIHDSHWHMGQAAKAAKSVEEAVTLGTCPVCKIAMDSQDHWLCRCPHPMLQDARAVRYAKIEEEALLMPIPLRNAVRDIASLSRGLQGNRVCVGNWSEAQVDEMRRTWPALTHTEVLDVLTFTQGHLREMVNDVWDTRARILGSSKRPTRPPVRREKYYVIIDGPGRGLYPSLSAARLIKGTLRTFNTKNKAEECLRDAMLHPGVVRLEDYARPETTIIWTDGSASPCTKVTAPRAGWGYLAQRGDSESSIIERFGPLHDPPDQLQEPGTLPSTNNMAELQALQGAFRWLQGGGARHEGTNPTTIVIVPDSKYAMGIIRGWSTPQQNKGYASQVRKDYEDLREAWPDTEFLWSWQKSHTKEVTRKAKGNAQADKLADRGMRLATPQPRRASAPRRTPPLPSRISPFAPNTRPTPRGGPRAPQDPPTPGSDQEAGIPQPPLQAMGVRGSNGPSGDAHQGRPHPDLPPLAEEGTQGVLHPSPRLRRGSDVRPTGTGGAPSHQDSSRFNGAVVSSSIVDFFRPVTPSLIIPRHVEGATRSLSEIDDMHFAILASSQSSHLGLTSIVIPVGVRSSADYPPDPDYGDAPSGVVPSGVG